MKDEHILKGFVRTYSSLLTSKEYDKQSFKEAIKEFYIKKHQKKYSFPSNRDCMIALISLLSSSLNVEKIHEMIDTLPFFRETGESQRQELHDQLKKGQIKSILPEEQIELIKKFGAYEAVVKHKGEEITKEKQKEFVELQKKIDAKRDEYDSLPSVLDSNPANEPDFNPEVEDIKPWWERFYLRDDPFPQKDGLSSISKDLYEAVIIKTEPFQKTLSNLQKNPNYLFHSGFLLVGDYGYGKTTFIDYLSNYLIILDVLPIRVTSAKSYADASGFMDSFLHKLRMELMDEAKKITAINERELESLELEDQIVRLSQKILLSRRKGILVFLDDYHKFRSHFPQIFEFLGTLQVLKDMLTRANLNVGFIVSGIPIWLTELRQNSQLMGFLDNTPIEMPKITPDLICEVFNRRIAAFCYESTPRRIKPDFVQKLVKDLGGEQGIRGCISRIVYELSNNNTAIVDSPVEISDTVLKDVRVILESDLALRSAFKKLTLSTKFKRFTSEQIARCLELLVHVSVQNGIAEDDRQFLENRFYFQVLRDVGLIQKQKGKPNQRFQWNLQHRLRQAADAVAKKNGLNLADYLLKLYAFKGYSERKDASLQEETSPIVEIKRFFNRKDVRIEKAVQDDVKEGLRFLESLLLKDPTTTPTESMLETAVHALDRLTGALTNLDTSCGFFARIRVTNASTKLRLHPTSNECILEALQRLDDYRDKKNTNTLTHAVKQITNALIEIAQKIRALAGEQCETTDALLYRPISHTGEEINLFQSISETYYSAVREDHFDCVKSLTDYLEIRFRKYLFFCGNLVFGEKYFEHCPKAVLSYAHKNLDNRISYAIEKNMFDGLTRPQFKSIFLENNALRDNSIKQLTLIWKDEDWRTFFDTFTIENIKTAHQQMDAFSPTEKKRYRRYANLAEELLAAMNEQVSFTLERNVFICIASSTSKAPSDCLFRSIFKSTQLPKEERVFSIWPETFPNKAELEEHLLADDVYKRILLSLRTKAEQAPANVVIQDLLDTDYLQSHYRVSLSDFIHSLAYAKYVSKELQIDPWFGSSVAIRKAST
jgi:hypothetical protein